MPTGGWSWFCDISAEKWVFSPSVVEGNVGDHPGDMEVQDEDGDVPVDVGDHPGDMEVQDEDGDVPVDVGDHGDGTDGIMFEAVS